MTTKTCKNCGHEERNHWRGDCDKCSCEKFEEVEVCATEETFINKSQHIEKKPKNNMVDVKPNEITHGVLGCGRLYNLSMICGKVYNKKLRLCADCKNHSPKSPPHPERDRIEDMPEVRDDRKSASGTFNHSHPEERRRRYKHALESPEDVPDEAPDRDSGTFNLSEERKKLYYEMKEPLTTEEEEMLLIAVFDFIAKQDKTFIKKYEEILKREEPHKGDHNYLIKELRKLAGDGLR